MNRYLSLVFILLLETPAFLTAQGPADQNEGVRMEHDQTNSIWRFSWWSRSGQTYFLQHTENLTDWQYFPDVIEQGNDAVKEWGFTTTADRLFLRLRYTDQPTTDPANDDFDGDGISNVDELFLGLDPLNIDSDSDQIFDGSDPAPLTPATGQTPSIVITSPAQGSTLTNAVVERRGDCFRGSPTG